MVSWGGGISAMARPLPVRFRPLLAAAVFAGLCLALVPGVLSGCKTVDISEPMDTTKTDTGTATLRISNNIAQDPDSLTFYRFVANAVDYTNAAKAVKIGGVAINKTGVFTVPSGTWKLAYADRAGTLSPMKDENSGGQEWLKAIFTKNGDYSLIVSSDGNRTTWDPTFKTDPAIK